MFARLFRVWRNRFRSAVEKDQLDAALSQELEFHFEQLVKENTNDGMTLTEARQAARRMLGNVSLLEEQCRDHRRLTWFHDLRQDALYGLRMMRRNPGFTAIATISLALGIGANTAILGVMDTVVRGNLPFPDADRLVVVKTVSPDTSAPNNNASIPDFLAWKEHSRVFETIGASIADRKDFSAGEDGSPPERVMGQGFSPGLFQTLGIQPMLGRVFTEAEAEIDNPAPVIVLSHQLWQRRFCRGPEHPEPKGTAERHQPDHYRRHASRLPLSD
jgi:putative ABC transport system permease protein